MEHLPYYIQLLAVLGPAALVAVFFTKLKQPPLIGYLLVGVALGLLGIEMEGEIPSFLAELGIMTLLFTAGLHIHPEQILKAGKQALILIVGQFVLLSSGGYLLGLWAGLSPMGAGILGIGLWLSSTIVVLGALERLGESEQPHGKTMMAVMVIQDLVALTVVALIPTLAEGRAFDQIALGTLLTSAKAGLMLGVTMLSGKLLFPIVFPWVEDDEEQLLVWPLAWALAHMGLAYWIGFSAETAVFFAGISISTLGYSYIVTDKIKSLSSLGLVFFFVEIGSGIHLNTETFGLPLLFMTLLVLVGTPLVNIPSAVVAGFGKRAAFVTGLVPAQISEFSLVILTLSARTGLTNGRVLSLVTAATAITMIASSVLAGSSAKLYENLYETKLFGLLEKMIKKLGIADEDARDNGSKWDVVIYGADMDYLEVAQKLQKMGLTVVILEPKRKRVRRLERFGLPGVKADYLDPDVVGAFVPEKILISTSLRPKEADLWTIKKLREKNHRALAITVNTSFNQIKQLQQAGWDIVVNPEVESAHRIEAELDKHLKEIYFGG